MRTEGFADAGNQYEETLVVPVVEHGHVHQLGGFNFSAGVGAVLLQQWRGASANVDGLGHSTRHEFEVHTGRRVGLQINTRSKGFAEALLFGFNFVGAGIQVDEEEVSGIPCVGAALEVGFCLGDGDFYAGNDGSGLIRNRSRESGPLKPGPKVHSAREEISRKMQWQIESLFDIQLTPFTWGLLCQTECRPV